MQKSLYTAKSWKVFLNNFPCICLCKTNILLNTTINYFQLKINVKNTKHKMMLLYNVHNLTNKMWVLFTSVHNNNEKKIYNRKLRFVSLQKVWEEIFSKITCY